MVSSFHLGIAQSKIDLGFVKRLVGYDFNIGRKLQGVHDPLFCKVLALRDDGSSFVFMVNDLIGLSTPFVRQLRSRIARVARISPSNILIACTHTHSGPPSMYMRRMSLPSREWMDYASNLMLQTVLLALSRAKDDVHVSWCQSKVPGVSFNRSERGGPVDEDLTVLSFTRKNRSMAVLVNFACHPTLLGPDNHLASADYPGFVRRAVETGGVYFAAFCNGAAGDIDSIPVRTGRRAFSGAKEVGEVIGQAALDCMRESDRDSRSTELRTSIEHVKLPLFLQEPSELEGRMKNYRYAGTLLGRGSSLLANFLKHYFIGWQGQEMERYRRRFLNRPRGRSGVSLDRSWLTYLEDLSRAQHIQNFPPALSVQVQAVRVGKGVLVAIPAELFCEIGQRIKKSSPFKETMIIGYANGLVGYIPTEDKFGKTGYASTKGPFIYGFPPFAPDVAENVVTGTLKAIQSVSDSAC